MIFDKLIILKTLLDSYKTSKNPFKKLMYHIRLKNVIDMVGYINNTIISIELLSEWHKFIEIADPDNISDIRTDSYSYSGKYAEEVIIKRDIIGEIFIILKFKNNSIDIEYPIEKNFRVNKVYKDKIDDNDKEVIRDKNTVIINNSIRRYIYNFSISYMKGEFDNV